MKKEFEVIGEILPRYEEREEYKKMIEYLNGIIKNLDVVIQKRNETGKNIGKTTMVVHTKKIKRRDDKNVLICEQQCKNIIIAIRSSKNDKNEIIRHGFKDVEEMKEKMIGVQVKTDGEEIKTIKKTLKQAILDEYDRLTNGDEYQADNSSISKKQSESTQSKPKIDFVETNDKWTEKMLEGKKLEQYRKQKQRNAKAREEKFKEAHNKYGKVFCEVCKEDEECVLDVHHEETYVKDMEENHVTELEDLNILCACCHRRIHGRKITVEELKNSVGK
ncbi:MULTISPECIES: hypothetical protein [unclassified Clostridium]|uniref:hypothetical protein n=1 Tax=unclassified Clostridium TaxID=2614128 RepID=UPI00207A73D0|nr:MULTISPECIES: hypothetical protein [unclassified Clostridium]